MTLSDNVAVTALVVSLVALLISLAQAALAFLNTADGYRRCGQSVLREWSQFRRRHFILSEFRFEVKYVTPQIALISLSELDEMARNRIDICLLNMQDLEKHPVVNETVHTNRSGGFNNSVHSPIALRGNNMNEIEKGKAAHASRMTHAKADGQYQPINFQNEMSVSWLRFLAELHHLYCSYRPGYCKGCYNSPETQQAMRTGRTDVNQNHIRTRDSAIPKIQPCTGYNRADYDRTDAAIYLRQWTWDFMPPDMVKPLAESTIGDIVVLARRLGMRWRTLNLDDGVMQADGNGFSLNATSTKGLGMVFTFSTVGKIAPFPEIIPSGSADKLLCGLLPGDPRFVRQDFPLVRNDRSLMLTYESNGILDKLGLAPIVVTDMKACYLPQFQNESLMLLMPFMPQVDSTVASFTLDGFLQGRKGIFAFWEGRYALMQALKHRIDHQRDHTRHNDLVAIYQHFNDLEQQYHEDFYTIWKQAAINNYQKLPDGSISEDITGATKLALIKLCREKFSATTSYFDRLGLANDFEETREGRTLYMILLGSHMRLMSDVCRPIYQTKFRDIKGPSQEQLTHDYTEGFPWINDKHRGRWISAEEIEYVRGCALDVDQGICHHDHGIAAFFARRGIRFANDPQENEDQCETLWWMLMLRGVAWTMSCLHNEDSSGLVPPIFYGNKTPVWIT